MYNFDLLFNTIDELNELFYSPNPFDIDFDYKIQKQANKLLAKYAREIGVFEKSKSNEKDNIEKGLTLRFKDSKIHLVNIKNMFDRVDNALDTDEFGSCITALSISNKCAHGLDDHIKSFSAFFVEMYNSYTGSNLANISFIKPFKKVYPNIKKIRKNDLSIIKKIITTVDKETDKTRYITNKEFNKLYNWLGPRKKPMHINEIKKHLKNDFKIDFKTDEEAQKIYEDLKQNRDRFKEAYLFHIYCLGRTMVALQNEMFEIKNYYTSLIGQMLSKGKFGNIKYELVYTPTGITGFEHMLIIDKPDLSYFVEVHLPDVIKNEFVKKYGFKVVERTTQALGASATYTRKRSEAKAIKKILNAGFIEDDSKENKRASTRAAIISRGINDEDPSNDELVSFEKVKKENKYFKFKGKKINASPISILTKFLKKHDIHRYDDILRFSDKLINNENYSIKITNNIACNYHYNIYQSLEDKDKELFVYEALNEYLGDYDKYDLVIVKELISAKEDNILNNDIIAKILIYKEQLKNIYKDEIKIDLNYSFNEYLEDLIYNYKEMDNKNERKL